MSRHTWFRLSPLDLSLALFLFSAALGVWPAYDRDLCWSTLIALSAGCLLSVLLARLAVSPRGWRAVAIALVLLCVLLAAYFVTQSAHFRSPGELRPIRRLTAFIGRVVPPLVVWAPMDNSVATFLEGGFFVAVGLMLTAGRPARRVGWGIGAGLIGLGLLVSESRGAWVAIGAALAVWLALHWRPARVCLAAGALVGVGLALYAWVRRDVAALGDVPLIGRALMALFARPDRLHVYRNSLYLVRDYALTGVGLGEPFGMVFAHYALLIRHKFLSISHNLYLQVWLEQGLLGAVAWLWLMVTLAQAAWTYRRPGEDLLYESTWLGLLATFIHGLSDAQQYADLWCWAPFFVLLGLNAAVALRRDRTVFLPATLKGRRWVLPAGIVGGFLVLALSVIAPLPATWQANLGCVLHARADLAPALDEEGRGVLRTEAADHYRRAIQIDPENRVAHQRLGLILMDTRRFQDAVEHLEIALRAEPENTATQKALGLAYVWVGDLDRASPLLKATPDIIRELNTWGWWWNTQQRIEQAVYAYRMSLLIGPDQPQVSQELQRLESKLGP